VPYVAGDRCDFNIQYQSGGWWMSCLDCNDMVYQVVQDYHATGTGGVTSNSGNLSTDNHDTSVWFETSESSYSSLKQINNGGTINATWATDTQNGIGSCWSQDSPYIQNAAGQQQSNGSYPNQIIEGGLSNNGTATWQLADVPLEYH
jgi:hypothetical protein